MSLTRDEWKDMWEICKEMEALLETTQIHDSIRKEMIRGRIDMIKKMVQQVIGHLE